MAPGELPSLSRPDAARGPLTDAPAAADRSSAALPSDLQTTGDEPTAALPVAGPQGFGLLDGPLDAAGSPSPEQRQLHPLPRGLVELYGFLAVLFVLVPEWMASGALFGFREAREGSELPPPSGAWRRLPELRLASLALGELRLLAREQRLSGYGRQSRSQLTSRLLKRLRARP